MGEYTAGANAEQIFRTKLRLKFVILSKDSDGMGLLR
jgi:hypothetical protein